MKFERDDKEYMTSEEVADFCTTPGGRKRDNMNFYTSGMKIVLIKEQTSVNSARVSVLFIHEQSCVLCTMWYNKVILYATQNLVNITLREKI